MSDAECPTCGRDDFASKSAMKVHHVRIHDERLVETIACAHCGDDFEPERDDSKYCSPECSAASQRKRITKTCPHCGDDFEIRPCETDQTHCSDACWQAAHRTRIECDHCGDEVVLKASRAEGRRFCSFECRTASGRETRTCAHCGDDFETQQATDYRFCSHKCANADRRIHEPRPCAYCGETFHPQTEASKYCSLQCVGRDQRQRVTKTCQSCGDDFEVRPSDDHVRFCSKQCVGVARRDRVTLECETCGDRIETTPSKAETKRFCSVACKNDAERLDRQHCVGCGGLFQPSTDDQSFCTHLCWAESHRTDRPDGEYDILYELYVEFDHTIVETQRRYNVIRRDRGQDRLGKTRVRDRLVDHGLFDPPKNYYGALQRGELTETDLGLSETPSGDESWRTYYQERGEADD